MGWATGIMVYFLVWWTVLFAVLPFGIQPQADAGEVDGGWRGAPKRPAILTKMIWTTVISTLLWAGIFMIVRSDWLSFRHGWLAMPSN